MKKAFTPNFRISGLGEIQKLIYFKFSISFIVMMLALMSLPSFAQTSPSGQIKFITPSTLSACNTDTICVELTNLKGSKGVNYSGSTTIEVNIPGGTLVEYINNSVSSKPTGATQVSYASNKLMIAVPLPVTGNTTKICFVVRPDCNIANLSTLPKFTGKVTYPAGFPLITENFTSASMNVGKAILTHYPYNGGAVTPSAEFFNSKPAFGSQFRTITEVKNNGYGNLSELTLTTIHNNAITLSSAQMWVYRPDDAFAYTVVSPVSAVPYNATQTIRTYKITNVNMGADGKLTPGETLRFDEWLIAPNFCSENDSEISITYSCSAGTPACSKPEILRPRISVAAGTPILIGTLISAEDPDGCPDKKVSYKIKNTGVGNAAPTGNAFDVDFNINFGGGLLNIKNLKINGIAVPATNILPAAANSNNFKILVKDLATTALDGTTSTDGVGLDDLDND